MKNGTLILWVALLAVAGVSAAGSYEVVYDSGDVQLVSYSGTLATTVNYTDGTITNPATKIVLSTFKESNMYAPAQEAGIGRTFSVDIYGDNSNTSIRFSFYVDPYDGGRFYKDVPVNFTGWQTISVNFADMSWYTPGPMTKEQALALPVAILQVNGPWNATPGTIYVDNLKLTIEVISYNEEVNLFQNGDAESAIDFQNWYHQVAPFAVENYTDSATYGSECFELNNTTDVYTSSEIRSLAIPSGPNEPYKVKFWYKTLPGFNLIDEAGIRFSLRCWENNTYANYIGGSDFTLPVTNGQWVQVVEEVITPDDPAIGIMDFTVQMNLFGSADGVLRIDEIELYDTNCPLTAGQELLDNGGFETGDLTSYHTVANASVVSTDASSGAYALQFGAGAVAHVVHSAAAVTGVENIIYSFDAKTPVGAAAPTASFVQIRFYDSDAGAYVDSVTAAYPLTEGQWTTITGQYPVPPAAELVDVFVRWEGAQAALLDNLSVKTAVPNCEQSYELADLQAMASDWLDNSFLPLLSDNALDNFEGYANQAAMENVWSLTSGTYPSSGSQTITLITNPAQAHSGSKALRWAYNNSGTGTIWSEFNTVLAVPVDLTQYNEMHVWVNRQPGNSLEDIFYIKFYNGSVAQSSVKAESWIDDPEGSTQTPTGWTKWVIDLDNLTLGSKADLDNVVGYFFGAVGQAGIGYGSGTIDFDDIVLVNTIPNCGTTPTWDLSGDCQVNLDDFVILGQSWMVN